MDFDLSKEQTAICDAVQDVVTACGPAELAGLDALQLRGSLLQWAADLAAADFLMAGDLFPTTLAQAALTQASPALCLSLSASAHVFGRLVAQYGTGAQRAAILPDIQAGKALGAVAYSESGISVENGPMSVNARIDGDSFVLSGSKGYVVGGPLADWLAVAAQTDQGPAWLLVESGAPGLKVGGRMGTLGFEGVSISGLTLEGCRIPASQALTASTGAQALASVRAWESALLIACSLGIMQRCHSTALKYAREHKSGPKPIIAYQEIAYKLSEMFTLMDTARLLAYKAAWAADTGDREASVLAASAKVFCCESAETVAAEAMQIMGGAGFQKGNPVEEGYRDAKFLTIAGVSSEISRMNIGDDVLESY